MGRNLRMQDLSHFVQRMESKGNFQPPKTPQQNGLVERKNRVIQEMARVMLLNKQIPQKFWGEVMKHLMSHWQ